MQSFETQRHRDHRDISEGPGATEFEGIKECKGSARSRCILRRCPRTLAASATEQTEQFGYCTKTAALLGYRGMRLHGPLALAFEKYPQGE